MIRRILPAALLLPLLAVQPSVSREDQSAYSAQDFREICRLVSDERQDALSRQLAAVCMGYVSGFSEALIFGGETATSLGYCPPGDLGALQTVEVFVKYATEHPERLHEHRGHVLLDALRDAFPCEAEE